jgi:toxin FitB
MAAAAGGRGTVFAPAVIIHGIENGIALLDHTLPDHQGAAAKPAGLKVWLAGLVSSYQDQTLGADAAVGSDGKAAGGAGSLIRT